MKKTLTLAALVALAGTATAQIESTGDLAATGPIPIEIATAPGAQPINATYTVANSFTLGDFGWAGNGTVLEDGTFGSELVVDVFLNSSLLGFIQIGTGASLGVAGDTFSFSGTSAALAGTALSAGDILDFSFGDTFDDPFVPGGTSGNGLPDAQWDSISFDLFDNFVAPPTIADFAVGTIPVPGSVSSSTIGSSDDFQTTDGNAFTGTGTAASPSGDEIWEINWAGGDFGAVMTALNGVDLDLYLYDANADLIDRAFTTAIPEEINVAGLPAGTYYLRVDGFFGTEDDYTLSVVPAPGAVALMGLAGVAGLRRRRA